MSSTNLFSRHLLFAALVACGTVQRASAAEATAFSLIKEGNRYVSEDARDKIVQIRSEKSVGGLTPNVWYIVYYDPDARFKSTEVKFGAGRKMDVKRPMRLLEPVTGDHRMLDRDKLKIDSDKAIRIATDEPLLKNLTVTATQLTLQRRDEMPVWKVRLWAARLRDSSRTADIGEVYVSAEDGKVVRNDLKIKRVD